MDLGCGLYHLIDGWGRHNCSHEQGAHDDKNVRPLLSLADVNGDPSHSASNSGSDLD